MMTFISKFYFIVIIYGLKLTTVHSASPRLLGSFHIGHPGYVTLTSSKNDTSYDVYVSCFNGIPFSADHVYRVSDIRTHLNSLSAVHPELITSSLIWPNEVDTVPDGAFNGQMISVASGFLVPFKTKGAITLYNITGSSVKGPLEITGASDHDWFYHRVMWADMNGDGTLDAVTCRAQKSVFGSSKGQLVWYEHPTLFRNDFLYPWRANVIGDNSDTFFDMTSLPSSDGMLPCIITTGYFSDQLKIYWTTDPQGRWTDSHTIHSRVVDDSVGHFFDVQVEDLNNDGTLDLLVTVNGNTKTGLFIYEIPTDFRTGSFIRHTLKSDFHTHNILPGGGAPGSAQIIRNPTKSHSKPLILLSGDDDSRVYLFSPMTNNTTDWTYHMDIVLDLHSGTIGGIGHGDVDGDGHLEIFVPGYSSNKIYVYTLKP